MRIVGNDPTLSRQITATASGAISAAGKPLIVNTDGTVSVVSSSPDVLGDETTVYSGDFQMAAAVYDEGQDKVLFIYNGASQYGYAVVGTVSGNSISFGTPVAFISSAASYVAATYDPDNAKTGIFWSDNGDSNKQKAVVATISGTSVSFGTVAIFSSVASGVPTKDSTYDTSQDKILVVYSKGTFPASQTIEAVAATISGTSISFGSETEIDSTTTAEVGVAYDANAGKSLVIYRKTSTAYIESRVLSLSGTTVSAGTETTLYGAAGDKVGITYDSTAQKLVAFYRHDSGTTHTKFIVATISGTSVSYGTPVDTGIDFNGTPRNNSIHHNVAANKIVFIGRDGGNSYIIKYIIATVSGTSITIDNTVTVYDESNDSYLSCNVYDPDQEKSVLFYADGTAGAFKNPIARVLTVGTGDNLTTENFIGTSAHAAADGAKVLVNTQGTVDENQSGLTAGQTFFVDKNGDLQLTTNVSASLATAVVFEAAATKVPDVCFDNTNNRIVVAYQDDANSDYGTAIVGTVASDGSISFGTPVVFESAATGSQGLGIEHDSNSNKVVIAYNDSGNSNHGTAIVGTVDSSDNSISFGSATVFNSGNTSTANVIFDSNSNKIVITYRDDANSYYGTAIVGTVSGTSISFGSEAVFESAETNYISSAFDSTNNRVVIAYNDGNDSGKGKAVVGTVSGTSISYGTVVTFENADTRWISLAYDSSNEKTVIAYHDSGNSDYPTAIVGTITGASPTDISFGTAVVIQSTANYGTATAFNSSVNKVVVTYKDHTGTDLRIIDGTVSGTSISFESNVEILDGGGYTSISGVAGANHAVRNVFDSNVNKTISVYSQFNNSSYGTAIAYTSGNDTSGSLSTDAVTAGTALSATKLLVKG